MENIKNFEQLVSICKEISKNHTTHSFVETRDYNDYGWSSVVIMTDHFGGVYINLHYDQKTGKITNWYGDKNAKVVKTVKQLTSMIIEGETELLKHRSLDAIYERINEEY